MEANDTAMCLTIPGKVIQIQGARAEVERDGHTVWYNALAQPDVKVGDYVLTHANLILAVVSEEQARQMLDALREAQELLEAEDDLYLGDADETETTESKSSAH